MPRIHRCRGCLPHAKAPTSVVFAIPIEGRFTMIGTTDVAISGRSSGGGIKRRRRSLSSGIGQPLFCTIAQAARISSGASPAVRPLIDDGEDQRVGGFARVPSQSRRAGQRAAAAQRHRRQDHDLSASRRGRSLEAAAVFSRHARTMDRGRAAARRRCRPRWCGSLPSRSDAAKAGAGSRRC